MRRGCCESRGLLMPFKQGSTKGQSIRPKLKCFHLWPSIAAFKAQSHQFIQICNNVFFKGAAVNHEASSCYLSRDLLKLHFCIFHIRPIQIFFPPNVWLWIRPKRYIAEDSTIHRYLNGFIKKQLAFLKISFF